jgi:hypothetical protein
VPGHDVKANLRAAWPSLRERPVTVGGSTVSYADAEAAIGILAVSRTSAIMPVLRAAGNPLAACDYFGASAPYTEWARYAPRTGRAGAAGRHVTKVAFLFALQHVLETAAEAELADAMAAFARDERYAVAIAREAVAVRERARAAGVRASVRTAVTRALAACGEHAGEFTCSEATACGTGVCRFASPAYRGAVAIAGPGKFTRPANHTRAGSSFTETAQAAESLAAGSHADGVPVFDDDAADTRGWAA